VQHCVEMLRGFSGSGAGTQELATFQTPEVLNHTKKDSAAEQRV
jgi:hypothetical protein